MKRLLLFLPLLMAPAAQAWPFWAEDQAKRFCEYRSVGVSTEKAMFAANRDQKNDYGETIGAEIQAAMDDGTYVPATIATIKLRCPGAWESGWGD